MRVRERWRRLFTRASVLIGLLIRRSHKQAIKQITPHRTCDCKPLLGLCGQISTASGSERAPTDSRLIVSLRKCGAGEKTIYAMPHFRKDTNSQVSLIL